MTGEAMNLVRHPQLLVQAEGNIDPQARVEAGQITREEINELAGRLETTEFDETISELAIPCMCVDGRCGKCALGPNASGGTLSLVIGDALTDGSYMHNGETAPQHAKRLYGELLKLGFRIGGHDDNHAEGQKSGCGAQDKLDLILDYIGRRGSDIKQLIESLGVSVDENLHQLITDRAQELIAEDYVTNGAELKQTYVDTAGSNSIDTVEGDHGEVVLRINMRPGTTLNRHKLKAEFGDKLQAFNLDVPSLIKGAEAISLNDEEAHRRFVAMLYYNAATATVLAGPSMQIIVAR